jgi:hypothetical protein
MTQMFIGMQKTACASSGHCREKRQSDDKLPINCPEIAERGPFGFRLRPCVGAVSRGTAHFVRGSYVALTADTSTPLRLSNHPDRVQG